MNVREKLVELLMDTGVGKTEAYFLSDCLIANGVTVQEDCKDCAESTKNCIVKLQEQIADLRSAQEWVSVKERLPEDELPKGSRVKQLKVLTALKSSNGARTVRSQMRYRMTRYATN